MPTATTQAPTAGSTALQPTSTPREVSEQAPPVFGYRVVHVYPHDPTAFTQGLLYDQGALYESTGRYEQSSLRKVILETGQVLRRRRLPQVFGEGLALCDNRLVQLTWKEQVGFVYDRDSFALLQTFTYPTEGWGLAFDGRRLVMSDGTAALRFLDPSTFLEIGRVLVHDDQGPVAPLNELEYVKGQILANVWRTNRIARIDPTTGRVTAWIDLTGLLDSVGTDRPVDVLNGIAYDAESDRLFVTGKLWPFLFEVELVPGKKQD